MDDMIVKSGEEEPHNKHFSRVFQKVQQFNMRLNPKKCIIRVTANNILDFYLIERGIEIKSDKCK